jgi:hypothetical protein
MKRLAVLAAVLLTGCASLPKELRREISEADSRLLQTQRQFQRTSDDIQAELKQAPDLFRTVSSDWDGRLKTAKARLAAAENYRRQLKRLDDSGRKEDIPRVRQLLADEDRLSQTALDSANNIAAQANRWLDFQRNLPHYLAKMKEQHDEAHSADFTAVTRTVERAEQDWPSKRADLDQRLQTLRTAPDLADRQWAATEAERQAATAGNATGTQVATLIQADDVLETSANLPAEEEKLEGLCSQLYVAWDKILEDLDQEHRGGDLFYREKLKTIRTQFAEAGDQSPRTSTAVNWVDVQPAAYQAVENDLGMAISHKDAGLYDSEAQNTAQPAGYAYIAPPSVGRNQYGYWSEGPQGSFWTFLPQYLIMRELFWGNSYRPIVVNEYNTYYTYARSGRTWYGEVPGSGGSAPAAPRYGTHGTFTQQHYASSRYVQSGGFKNSAFASRPSNATQATPAQPHYGNAPSDSSPGKRFGNPGGSTPSGQRFGSPRSSPAPSSGKRFGGGSRRR